MSEYILKPKFMQEDKKLVALDYKSVINNTNGNNIILETYIGVNIDNLVTGFQDAGFDGEIIFTSNFVNTSKEKFREHIIDDLTEDRVFGKLSIDNFHNYFDKNKIKKFKNGRKSVSRYLVIGVCAYLFKTQKDVLIYSDITRWKLQLKARAGEKIFFLNSIENDKLKNFKRGYFIEWRWADRIKQKIWQDIDFFLDISSSDYPKMASGDDVRKSINEISQNPFRAVPYFDAGVWGGQWMEKKLNLGKNEFNRWAWAFDGVPEENSIMFQYENDWIELPAINVVLFEPQNLLGQKIIDKFGFEFPIRFDFLDTIDGGNLSLQVHPSDAYIMKKFNMPYGQNESYYMLDIDPKAKPTTYLGFKSGVNKDEFISALKESQTTSKMDVEKYVNKIPVKKHDHLIHPSGVIHSSASGCMVLEISSTPYIFTFKLWDWGRLGLDGKSRPINIEHGENVLNFDYTTNRVMAELVNPFETIVDNEQYTEIHTGLHKDEQFIETRRFTIKTNEGVKIKTKNSVNQLNLVEGEQAIIESTNNSFKPLIVNYAETFIVPKICEEYSIKPFGPSKDKTIMVLQAYVR